jgi:DNA-binding response OmpR family regulator
MLHEVSHQLLVVEDDDDIAMPLVRTLEREGYDVDRVATGSSGLERAGKGDVDLVVLDLGLPDLDGLEVCRQLRADGYDRGILILTARSGELDRVDGLDVGADDYLGKPFALAELLARTRALLRRSARPDANAEPTEAAPADLRVDAQARQAWVDGYEITLTSKEFDLLVLLEAGRGTVLTREKLMDEVWDENWFGSTKTLDVTMGRLRQKLEHSRANVKITTIRGVGFRLESA